jgi:hypothetical protein
MRATGAEILGRRVLELRRDSELAGISVSMRQGPHQAQEREGDHQRDDEAAPVEAVKSDGFPSGNDGDLTWASGW